MGNASQCEKSRSAEGRCQGVPISLASCQMASSEENKHVTPCRKLIFQMCTPTARVEDREINLRTVDGCHTDRKMHH